MAGKSRSGVRRHPPPVYLPGLRATISAPGRRQDGRRRRRVQGARWAATALAKRPRRDQARCVKVSVRSKAIAGIAYAENMPAIASEKPAELLAFIFR